MPCVACGSGNAAPFPPPIHKTALGGAILPFPVHKLARWRRAIHKLDQTIPVRGCTKKRLISASYILATMP